MAENQKQSGRRGRMDERFTFMLPEKIKEQLQAVADADEDAGGEISKVVRRAIVEFLDPSKRNSHDDPALQQSRVPFLTKAPCGPWEEALEHSGDFVLSLDVADELGMREGDVVVRTVGDSMEGAGIPDGALLLMRPLQNGRVPRARRIALVQIINADGAYLGTVKRWHAEDKLTDGADKAFPIPKNVKTVEPVAELIGIITQAA